MQCSQTSLKRPELDIKYSDGNIHTVNATIFLGLTIDRNLKQKIHKDTSSKKIITYTTYTLYKILNINSLLTPDYGLL